MRTTNYEGQTKIFPNPASNFVNLLVPDKTDVARLNIYDHTGRVLINKQYQLNASSNFQVDISDYSPGILFFYYEHNGKRSVFKIMKK